MKKVFCVTLIILFFCLTMIPIGCRTTENDHALSDGSSESVTSLFMEKVYDEKGEISANGTKSLLDRIDPGIAAAFNYGTKQDPIYYLVPYEWGMKGFIYNHDLFQKKGWLTYSGVGGVPKTTEEFIDLLNKISDAGYIAYTLSLENEQYLHEYQYGFLAQYEGRGKSVAEFNV